ncbi:bifunctional aspartokinase/homoserine dehydrogenase 2 [Candidatus Photodesmus katoptron]|uniref:Aspartokinase n=1 Tax=Candidatus Photodesmus katoptron Akat1 TaxID=1236703 RepID=S3DIC2_9GAMM|nr:bifunctional aspartokinase/homoserine dehydrogenase [Candidatus Photodesmus katoptron Akat1]KEY90289.1 bifunctional aspartokinase/homoserine dehydrogenase 2 [Candidatus Photodesmus katoptron]
MTFSRQLHKFGGSSLASKECYRHVVQILKKYSNSEDLIVVSAAGNTTDYLIKFLKNSFKDKKLSSKTLQVLYQFQTELVKELLNGKIRMQLLSRLDNEFSILQELTRTLHESKKAMVLGYGELWSARLLTSLLCQENLQSVLQDSRTLLRANSSAQPEIDSKSSYPLIKKALTKYTNQRLIITGFMAKNLHGNTVLLGRNGSDYSATIIGSLAKVSKVTIWSDVMGIYSADPRIVDNAYLLPLLRLDEASELARLASPVLHSRTLQPVAKSKKMDLTLRSTKKPESGLTRIERVLEVSYKAKIITSLEQVLLIHLTFHQNNNFNTIVSNVLKNLKLIQLEPLAFQFKIEQQTIYLAYTEEIANEALDYLQNISTGAEIKLKTDYSLIAAIGAGIIKNTNHCYKFYQQIKSSPVEFISKSQLSLVAILYKTPVFPLVIDIHNHLFQTKKKEIHHCL